MGLFDKKFCSICGEKIGLLGNRKLEDGNLCKDCAAKLSPWFTERKQSTVEEIKEQLAYREANKEAVSAFQTTRTLGRNIKVLLDEDAGKFMVTSARNIAEANPDVLSFSDVTGCDLNVEESKTEIRYRDANNEVQSFNPKRYAYSYDFYMNIHVNHPYFDEIRFKLNDSSVDGDVDTMLDYDEVRGGAGRAPMAGRNPMAGSGTGRPGTGRPTPGAGRPGAAGGRPQPGRPQPGGARPMAGGAGRPTPGAGRPGAAGGRPQPGRPQPGGARPMGQRPMGQNPEAYGAQPFDTGMAGGMGAGFGMDLTSNADEIRNSAEYIEYENMGWEIRDTLLQVRADARAEEAEANAPKQAIKCPYCGATTIPTANGCCEYCGAAL